jgi:hypothetical protein
MEPSPCLTGVRFGVAKVRDTPARVKIAADMGRSAANGGVIVAYLLILVSCSQGNWEPKHQPTGVPPHAIFAGGPDGGAYIWCDVDGSRNGWHGHRHGALCSRYRDAAKARYIAHCHGQKVGFASITQIYGGGECH